MQFYKKHLAFRAHYSVCGLEFTTVSIVFKVLEGEKLACGAKEMSQTYTRELLSESDAVYLFNQSLI